jgi:putative Holliday junction resolvase
MRRIVALDIGTVRIGVAVSDPSGTFAQPLDVLTAGGEWLEELGGILERFGAGIVLVGMPRRTDGTDGPEAGNMRAKIRRIAERFPAVKIIEWDERFTTTIATQALLEGDVSRRGRRDRVDKVAATLLLQSYLDAQNASETGTREPTAQFSTMEERRNDRKKRDSAYD